jgi:hypothetical protein
MNRRVGSIFEGHENVDGRLEVRGWILSRIIIEFVYIYMLIIFGLGGIVCI